MIVVLLHLLSFLPCQCRGGTSRLPAPLASAALWKAALDRKPPLINRESLTAGSRGQADSFGEDWDTMLTTWE